MYIVLALKRAIFTVGGVAPKYGAPPKKHLHVLPTARWRALAMGSVAAAVRLLVKSKNI